MMEKWKDVVGYEGKYEVSNLGRVRSLNYLRTGKAKLLKQQVDKYGYKRMRLYKDGKAKSLLVHRLVAMAFLPNPNNLPMVNHKDENKTNNNVDNLEWCTASYNNNYGTKIERQSKSMTGKKGKDANGSKPILMYDQEGNFIKRFDSTADANEYFGKDRYCSSIGECLRGKRKTTYGFIFKYEKKENN